MSWRPPSLNEIAAGVPRVCDASHARRDVAAQPVRESEYDRTMRRLVCFVLLMGCGGGGGDGGPDAPPLPLPSPSCAPASGGGSATVAAPALAYTLFDRWHEGWLASPAVADLDGDGTPEIIAPRDELLLVWHTDNTVVWRAMTGGRIWSSPVVADLLPGRPGLEVAIASRGQLLAFDATGASLPGFPVSWRDEMRTLGAGDIDGDGALELVVVTNDPLDVGAQRDILMAYEANGSVVAGFPPNTGGSAGCDDACYVTGGYDQNLAIGDVDGDRIVDIFAPHDNAYASLHAGTGRAFDAAPIFRNRTKFSGIRMMVDYALAQQGFANDEDTEEQGHFTNSAPAIADLDGDGTAELVLLGSVQNAAQTDRERGVALWVMHDDGTRPAAWIAPPKFPQFLSGLWDYGDNVVGITNQPTVVDLDPSRAGLEIVFAGFDGWIHAVDANAQTYWSYHYTSSSAVATGGVVVADLSGDGIPEVVLTTYSTSAGQSHLIVLDAAGNELHRIPLPDRGAMPVPTIADADADGDLDIVVSLKDGEDRVRQVQVYEVPGSSANCLLWPTGRGNYRRDGYVPPSI
jgi:hypothetical protein